MLIILQAYKMGELHPKVDSVSKEVKKIISQLEAVNNFIFSDRETINRFSNEQEFIYKKIKGLKKHKKIKDPNTFVLFNYFWQTSAFYGYINLGDYIQTYVTRLVLDKLYSPQYKFWDRDSLSFFDEREKFYCLMQGWFAHSYNFLPSSSIEPIWIGVHLSLNIQNFIPKILVVDPNFFNKIIGCRDFSTYNFLRRMNINAYVSRCLTLLFSARKVSKKPDRVYLVDIPCFIKEALPVKLVNESVSVNQKWLYVGNESWEKSYSRAVALVEEYSNNAKLVITTALHCATTCIALNIPVILISLNEENDERFSVLNGIIKPIHINDIFEHTVNYDPNPLDISNLKFYMEKNLELTIKQEKEKKNYPELNDIRTYIMNYSVNS